MAYLSQILWYVFWIVSIYLSYLASIYAINFFEKKYNSAKEVAEPVENIEG